MNVEAEIQKNMFSKNHEKTFIDKLLSRKEIEEIKKLVKKPNLNRSELLELLYLIGATEQKLVNYDEWNRYVILKFFVWLRDFISVCELWFDVKDQLDDNQDIVLSDQENELLERDRQLLEHNAKFLVDLYLNIGRTSLSINATGFFELMRNKYEISYPEAAQQPAPKTGLFGLGIGK